MTHTCVSKLTIIGSDNGLSPGRHQPIIRTNAGTLLIGSLGTNFGGILIDILTFSFKEMHFKMSSGKLRPFYLSLNVLTCEIRCTTTLWNKMGNEWIDKRLHVNITLIMNICISTPFIDKCCCINNWVLFRLYWCIVTLRMFNVEQLRRRRRATPHFFSTSCYLIRMT